MRMRYSTANPQSTAQIVLPSSDLDADMAFFKKLGFKLLHIFPADDPAVATMHGHALTISLERGSLATPGLLRLPVHEPARVDEPDVIGKPLQSPGGTHIEWLDSPSRVDSAILQAAQTGRVQSFSIQHMSESSPWSVGRAGMLYRDLIPDRVGGRVIASHIRIPDGGPVPDMVHFHKIHFQLIYCIRGWVDVIYEDQGSLIRLTAGDCVTQPPHIRHRVVEASNNLEVIEIGTPADHPTVIDHDMPLPTAEQNVEREFSGQRFCHHRDELAEWHKANITNLDVCNTAVHERSGGQADVCVMRHNDSTAPHELIHSNEVLIQFVLSGSATLSANNASGVTSHHDIGVGCAFIVPPDEVFAVDACTPDFKWLVVALPGKLAMKSA